MNERAFLREVAHSLRCDERRAESIVFIVFQELRERITTKAKAGGYNLVLDISAESINQTDVILFSSGLTDLTDEVLSDLNANAPASLLRDEKPSAEKKEDKK